MKTVSSATLNKRKKWRPRKMTWIAQSITAPRGAEIQTQACGINHYTLLPQREEPVSVLKKGSLLGWKDPKLPNQKAWLKLHIFLVVWLQASHLASLNFQVVLRKCVVQVYSHDQVVRKIKTIHDGTLQTLTVQL